MDVHHPTIDMIRKEVIKVKLRVTPIYTNLHEGRLRWFGNVQRKSRGAQIRRVKSITIYNKGGLKRLNKTWEE